MGNNKFNRSEQCAYDNGFKVVQDDNAYNGRYFIKKNKIWIHNIEALKNELNVTSDKELKKRGYHIKAYYKYNQL